jgi:hypothetical protein
MVASIAISRKLDYGAGAIARRCALPTHRRLPLGFNAKVSHILPIHGTFVTLRERRKNVSVTTFALAFASSTTHLSTAQP